MPSEANASILNEPLRTNDKFPLFLLSMKQIRKTRPLKKLALDKPTRQGTFKFENFENNKTRLDEEEMTNLKDEFGAELQKLED